MGDLSSRSAAVDPLSGSLREYRDPKGTDLFARVNPFFEWQDMRRQNGFWPYSRSTDTAPQPLCRVKDDAGRPICGVNFASQDYLNLSSNPAIKAAARAAIDEFGVHSAGSGAFLGNTKYSLILEQAISDFLQLEHTLLYPTGWAAGYGVIRGLVRAEDHVVIDALAHNCLQDGALAATPNVHLHRHLSLPSVRRLLHHIRAHDTRNAILVITESLFSMHSDTPDIRAMQELCREFGARLMVDVAHDLGNLGDDGRGQIGRQKMTGKVDLVMGSFSKTFASNGGFVACNSAAVREYLRYFGSSGTFSNALSPVQSATVLKAFEIVSSEEGGNLRAELMRNSLYLRGALASEGLEVLGDPSAIVSIKIDDEGFARIVSQRLGALGAIVNLVEYPAVARGSALFRLQVMAKHTRDNIDRLVSALRLALSESSGTSPCVSSLADVELLPRRACGE
ncbi:MAG: aminotransferase class I/II-fold pyridoxal phosphate-dependent enzyme [Alphaproteobacteria bacterium]|nr:aminotransferase class I/II-fold pyridoxal phosphate-dependent enzyme [Alphaproteobacteria bacterium]